MRYSNIEKKLGDLISKKTNITWDVKFPKIIPPMFFVLQQTSMQKINQLEHTIIKIECVSKNNDLLVELVRKIQKIVGEEKQNKTITRHIEILSTGREHSFDTVFEHKFVLELQVIEK